MKKLNFGNWHKRKRRSVDLLPEALSTIMINAQKKICIKIGGKIKITYTFHFLEIKRQTIFHCQKITHNNNHFAINLH
jgi:hypothetical protein